MFNDGGAGGYNLSKQNGMFNLRANVNIAAVTDGTSNVIMAGEQIQSLSGGTDALVNPQAGCGDSGRVRRDVPHAGAARRLGESLRGDKYPADRDGALLELGRP